MVRKTDWRELGGLLGLMLLVVILWDTVLVYPLQILVVFFHELSHGLAAMVTGGSVQQIFVASEVGGACLTAGGNRLLILSSGYLGSLACGGAILILATRTQYDKLISGMIGGLMILVCLFWVRPFPSFGFAFCLSSGLAMLVVAKYLSPAINDYLLKVIGLTSCLYAILDIKGDIIDRPGSPSDAYLLAEQTGLPVFFWGVLWINIAVVAALGFLLLACRKSPTPTRIEEPL